MFSHLVQIWFEASFPSPTEVQARGWESIRRGAHALLVAPTGSGKTLAAFLAGIDALATRPPDAGRGTRLLYVSPLKALVYDIERNLRSPLAGVRRTAERLGVGLPQIRVSVRTGDTTTSERARHARDPGEILVTTPESLFLILGSAARATLTTVETVIIDEVHALAPTKRGAHLALSLERLCEITEREPQRIGLSATARPIGEIARFLGGSRPVEVVDASARPYLDVRVIVPVEDMTQVEIPDIRNRPRGRGHDGADAEDEGGPILAELYERAPDPPSFTERGIWPAIYPEILEEIRKNRSTLVFVNSRGLCERLAQRLNDLAGEQLVLAHHGSVSHEKRREIEEGLKEGRLRGIVATSSLELGIDMGAIDRVVLVESPGTVARGLQRIGRAGHKVGETSVGRIYPKYRGDLLECAVITERMVRGEIEEMSVPRNTLDVLAQQVVAMVVDRDRTVEEIAALAARSYSYAGLTSGALESVLDMLSGRYPSTDFADLRPLLSWDRARDRLSARRGAALVSRMNPGTIPDRGYFPVHLAGGGPRLGELDEEMVFESRTGDRILLGATSWKVEEIQRDRVIVSPSPGEPGRLPFWKGDGPGRPIEIGRAVGAFLGLLERLPRASAAEAVTERVPLDPMAASNLVAYVHEQIEHAGCVPTDKRIVIERFRDELGDWRVCILTPFGARVHAPWAMAIQGQLTKDSGFDVQTMVGEDGIVLRFADADDLPDIESLIPDPDEVQERITEQLGDTALFAGLFRENAVRSLLLPRRRPTQRNPLWAQRIKSQQLLASVRKFPTFPIVLETYRQALEDVFDLRALRAILRDIRSRRVQMREVRTQSPSPFARSLVFAYVANYMYEQDAPLAERRAQVLTVDRNLLHELLGTSALRDLIDADVLAELEEQLQRTAPGWRARDADELHDLLRRLGDATADELRERSTSDPVPWLQVLERERRAIEVGIAGERRWVAAEDAGLYRDALGAHVPAGLPSTYLDPVDRALEALVTRFALHRGPFEERDVIARYALASASARQVLEGLQREGVLVHGEIRPGGSAPEWCHAEILRRLKRNTLARLRNEIAPVDASVFASFLPDWHGVGSHERGNDRLLEVIAQIEGASLPWSDLVDSILPRRVAGFRVEQLDMLCSSGRILWVGHGPVGMRDGRIGIYLREHAAALVDAPVEGPTDPDPDPLRGAILSLLADRGASFLHEIETAVRRTRPDLREEEWTHALWDLVWAGRVTNDTFGPLQDLRWPARSTPARRRRGVAAPGGRWWRTEILRESPVSAAEGMIARARVLLERYGVVSREAARAERMQGGFGALYRTLRAMEEAGKIRRGYFVEGIAGIQFAHAGAVDRLRAIRADLEEREADPTARIVALSAVDPANPYGVLLPWPPTENPELSRPRRIPGAIVVLSSGRPSLYVSARKRELLLFAGVNLAEILPAALDAVRALPVRGGRRRLVIEAICGIPFSASPHVALLHRCGFERSYRGLVDVGGGAA